MRFGGSALVGDQGFERDLGVLPLQLGQPPLVAEQREQGAVVTASQHLGGALPGQRPGALGVGPPGQRVVQVVKLRARTLRPRATAEAAPWPAGMRTRLSRALRGADRLTQRVQSVVPGTPSIPGTLIARWRS